MPPVSPGQPSSFGSVFADSPGLLRENGWGNPFTLATSADEMYAICSATAPGEVTQFQTQLDPLGPGDSLNIFSIAGANASNTDPMMVALKTGSKANDATNPTLLVFTAQRNGPWFQHFELPVKVLGPATGTLDVYLKVITKGATTNSLHAFNRVTVGLITYRKP